MNLISDTCNKCRKCCKEIDASYKRKNISLPFYEEIVYYQSENKIIHSVGCFKEELEESDLDEQQKSRLNQYKKLSITGRNCFPYFKIKQNLITSNDVFYQKIKIIIGNENYLINDCPFYTELFIGSLN